MNLVFSICFQSEVGEQISSQATKKLFVGGVRDGMSEEDMQEIFGEQGEVERVSMVRDKATGKLKAYCFIQFADEDTTDKCVCKCPSSPFENNASDVFCMYM